ncbi:MAG: hypothetical protein KY442_07065 [Proteobacteria bacterium]|nr:hypothetical protein [Pseudomonadota bacterium]
MSQSPQENHAVQLRAVLFDADFNGHEIDRTEVDCRELANDQLLWIDLQMGSDDDLPDAIARCGIDARQLRPTRADDIGVAKGGDDWTVLYARALNSARDRRFCDEPLNIAIATNLVITAHCRPIDFLGKALDNEAARLRIGGLQASSFAASLLDRMLTDYLDARDEFESDVDRIESLVLQRPRTQHLSELQQLRSHASRLRKYLAMQRDMFDALGRPDFDVGQPPQVARHWQLLSARYSKVMASVESARELVNSSFGVYTSRVAHGTGETMRLLTGVTVVLGTMTAVAAALGMNFDARVFDSGNRGFWWVAGAMLGFAIAAVVATLARLLLRRRRS